VSYVGRLADGTVFDERREEDPLEFITDEGEE
jgi:FKBP-type peptidyl-prolyl cis-trans isomerase